MNRKTQVDRWQRGDQGAVLGQIIQKITETLQNKARRDKVHRVMFRTKSHNNNMLNRGHSFINRTPHTVLSISGKGEYGQIVGALGAGIPARQISKTGPASNVRCVKIEDCDFGDNQSEQQAQLPIPSWISTGILQNITKLVISRCKVRSMRFGVQDNSSQECGQQLFPNLQQFEGTINNLIEIPTFLYNCWRLVKVNVSNNQITQIDNRLTQLNELKYVGLLSNRIGSVGVGFCEWAVLKDIGIDLQWHITVLHACVHKSQQEPSQSSAPVSMESTIRIGTTITQADYQLNLDELMIPTTPPNSNLVDSSDYFAIAEEIPLLFTRNKDSKMVVSQIQTLLHCQHLQYLRVIQQFITEDLCHKYIDDCFAQRKYSSLDFLIQVKNKLTHRATGREALKQKIETQTNQKQVPKSTKSSKQQKQNKQNKQIKLAVRKQIKMLQLCENSKTKNKTNQKQQLLIAINQYSKLLIPVVMTFNIQNYKQIPLAYFYQITKDDFIWILNQLDIAEKCKTPQQIQAVFSSPYFQKMFNHSIKDEEDLQQLANNVHHKTALKKLFVLTQFKFFDTFDFSNVSVLKLILRLDDFVVFKKFYNKYKSFTEALFSNVPRSYSMTTTDGKMEINSVNTTKSIICQSKQGTSWKYLVFPHSKLYKYILKQYKKYIAKQLSQDQNKNLHFPEYIQPQSLLIHNDVHDYDMLKDYEEFQASFCHKDLRLHVRHSNIGNNWSISKKIYMQVVHEASSKIRQIGKSREKLRSDPKIINKTFVCKDPSLEHYNFENGLPSPTMLSCARTQKQGIQTTKGKKLNQTSNNVSSKKINSIQVSYRKQSENIQKLRKKKNGIIIYSNSESQLKSLFMNKQEENGTKTIYLDLSKNRNLLSNRKNTLNSNTSGNDNLNSSQIQRDLKNSCNQVQCSTFDIT